MEIEPYSIKEYTIHRSEKKEQSCPRSTIEYFDERQYPKMSNGLFTLRTHHERFIKLQNRFLAITFSQSGGISSIEDRQREERLRFSTHAIRYSTARLLSPHSGAYLFIPTGEADEIGISNDRLVRFQRGPLIERFDLIDDIYALHYRLTNVNGEKNLVESGTSDQEFGLTVKAHLQMKRDTELALRFYTGIRNGAGFFTDLNGYQVGEECNVN